MRKCMPSTSMLHCKPDTDTACFIGCPVWVPERKGGANAVGQKAIRWVKGTVTGTQRGPDGATVLQVGFLDIA